MIIRRIKPLVNDHSEDLATCKESPGGTCHLQIIIWRIRPLANDHLEGQATCKWSSRGSGLLQMIIRRIWPLANDHLEGRASNKWSSITPITLVTSERIQIQSRGPFWNNLFLFSFNFSDSLNFIAGACSELIEKFVTKEWQFLHRWPVDVQRRRKDLCCWHCLQRRMELPW